MAPRQDDYRKALDIEVLIAEESDPRNRALLIILNSIDHSLRENVLQTHEVREEVREVSEKFGIHELKLTTHLQEVEVDKGKFSGAKMMFPVVAVTCGALITLATYTANNLVAKVNSLEFADKSNARIHDELKQSDALQIERFGYINQRLVNVETSICKREGKC